MRAIGPIYIQPCLWCREEADERLLISDEYDEHDRVIDLCTRHARMAVRMPTFKIHDREPTTKEE